MQTGILGVQIEVKTKQHTDGYKVMLPLNDSHEGLGQIEKALEAVEDLGKERYLIEVEI